MNREQDIVPKRVTAAQRNADRGRHRGDRMPLDQDKFLDELVVRIRVMTPQTRLYRVLRDGLGEKGYWRKRGRGNPKLGYQRMLEAQKKKTNV